jgi:hypothetical protein
VQDQTIGLEYGEDGGQRIAGLNVWDRSEVPLDQLMAELDAPQKLPTDAERKAALDAIRAANRAPRRVFVGKDSDRAAVVTLSDAHGKPRLSLKVDPTGTAGIDATYPVVVIQQRNRRAAEGTA